MPTATDKALICSITPYFLEKGFVWFSENEGQIIQSINTQPFFQDNVLCLELNQNYNFSELLRRIDEMGYEKVQTVEDMGEFSQRGGIIDVFPINLERAIRFEFLGNRIENIEQLGAKIENEQTAKEILKKKLKSQKIFSDIKGIKPGDYLTHLDHGIGKFIGTENLKITGQEERDYYIIEYAKEDKLFVPFGLERKLSRYIGFTIPKISSLGSQSWQRIKRKIKEEAEKLARELLEIYAKRQIATRSPYASDQEIQDYISGTFRFQETPDQISAIQDIKNDMAKEEPMDRLICGDVGFGKTEVALRAAVISVASNRQVAMICPTTILANQHFQNFQKRLKETPIKIAVLSRLQSKKLQQKIIEELKFGSIDIIIGTHRLLSKDVNFKNLGLFIIDDEQRFGVKQKEKFKQARASLDVLSLSATPIPRTLYMILSSLKNTSIIQTPPEGRLPIKTYVLPFQEKTIKKAIENELSREGQVYFLYNRIETIIKAKEFLKKLLPNIKLGIAHGRMKEKDLMKVIDDFSGYDRSGEARQEKKIDVLVATTIIESGLDFPNANTLIVADSTKLGLSQAHQIRGRIGRSFTQSFAYFLHPKKMQPLAKLRLRALKEAQELGSGYRIALRDLEIRGAGNILGKEQSGSINQVGLNLYCQMLADSVEKLRSQESNKNNS